ncbi:MAG: M20/M25/M40 family metallo-hydrolase, partial [Brachybacterium tyrofermentans]
MPIADPSADELTVLQDEAVQFTRELIRIDTTNFGGNDPATWGVGETEAADYVVAKLREVGLEPEVHESAPGRPSVFVRMAGEDRDRGGLI